MNKLAALLLAPAALFSQGIAPKTLVNRNPAAPAVEFTSTSNASQAGVSLVLGYQFTVRTPVILTSLGAVLNGSSSSPVFGALPASMPVALWDENQNLLVSTTVSASDPAMGHFNYRQVAKTLLAPGVAYTIAGLAPPGASVLSDVPDLTTGSEIVFAGSRSFASKTLVFPEADTIGLRKNYFGAGFTYTGATEPVALSGRDRNVAVGNVVTLDGLASFSEAGRPLAWEWTLVSKPVGSKAELNQADSSAPSFTPDLAGLYVARLVISDISDRPVRSRPSTVSITAASIASR